MNFRFLKLLFLVPRRYFPAAHAFLFKIIQMEKSLKCENEEFGKAHMRSHVPNIFVEGVYLFVPMFMCVYE